MRHEGSRRPWRAATIAALALSLAAMPLVAVAQEEAPAEPVPMRFALQPNLNAVNFWVAQANGYFVEQGIAAEITPVDIGFNGVQLAVTGQAQAGGSSTYPMVNIYAGGGDQIVPAVYAVVSIQKIVTTDEVQAPADLVGKRVAIAAGSIFEYSFTRYLLDSGIEPEQVEIVPVDAPEQPAALARGDVDAIVNVDPLASQALEALGDRGHLLEPSINWRDRVYLQMNRDWVNENPDAVVAMLRALVQASEFVSSNPDEAWAIVAEELDITPEEVQAQVEAGWEFDIHLYQDDIDETMSTAEFMLERGILTEDVDVTGIFDPSFLQQVDPELVSVEG